MTSHFSHVMRNIGLPFRFFKYLAGIADGDIAAADCMGGIVINPFGSLVLYRYIQTNNLPILQFNISSRLEAVQDVLVLKHISHLVA